LLEWWTEEKHWAWYRSNRTVPNAGTDAVLLRVSRTDPGPRSSTRSELVLSSKLVL